MRELKINVPHRIYRIYGRQLSVARADGSLATAAVFFANDCLYQIESTKFAGGSAAAVRKGRRISHCRIVLSAYTPRASETAGRERVEETPHMSRTATAGRLWTNLA
jgi:hypothetical protein